MSENELAYPFKLAEQECKSTCNHSSEQRSSHEETETGMERRYSRSGGTTPDSQILSTLVTFRKGRIEVSDPTEFHRGKVCGQAAIIDSGEPAKEKDLFRLFADGVQDIELSEAWLVGFFLGAADALLRGRKTFPREMGRSEVSMG